MRISDWSSDVCSSDLNVTVLLDGRFAVRTDSLGNFEFPRVAAGSHVLTVVPDNLPLPWFINQADAQRSVQVRGRETARNDIGPRRQRQAGAPTPTLGESDRPVSGA